MHGLVYFPWKRPARDLLDFDPSERAYLDLAKDDDEAESWGNLDNSSHVKGHAYNYVTDEESKDVFLTPSFHTVYGSTLEAYERRSKEAFEACVNPVDCDELLPVEDPPGKCFDEWYFPIDEHPELVTEFVNVPSSNRESIRRFAQVYGSISGFPDRIKRNRKWVACERLSHWVSSIQYVRLAFVLWQAIADRNEKAIRNFVEWRKPLKAKTDTAGWYFRPATCSPRIEGKIEAIAYAFPRLSGVCRKEAYASSMEWYSSVVRDTSCRLKESADIVVVAKHALVLLLQGRVNASPILTTDRDAIGLAVRLRPATLKDAILLQLLFKISHGSTPGVCEACGAWFIRIRRDKKTCSDACRKEWSRTRSKKV